MMDSGTDRLAARLIEVMDFGLITHPLGRMPSQWNMDKEDVVKSKIIERYSNPHETPDRDDVHQGIDDVSTIGEPKSCERHLNTRASSRWECSPVHGTRLESGVRE